MAASLSRPDPTSPASVAEAGFSTSRRGYQPDEVRAFLTSVAAEMGRLKERERQLEAELRAARAASSGRIELDDETVTNLLGEETLRVLQTARESASQIKVRAEDTAARTMREAHDEANRVRQEAEVESARRRHDAQSDAEAEVAVAKQQGREMVNEARAYRERVLADLERRTKLARQHIEELAQGRDRLLQVFERARLVAVDVTTDLQAAAGPDEYVSLSPTTGPVPLMVPASEVDRPSHASADDMVGNDDVVDADASDAETSDVDTVDVDIDMGIGEPPTDDATPTIEVTDVTEITDITEVVETEVSPVAGRDTNVVALFRGRPAEEGTAPEEDRSVDDLFARLRNEVPEADGEAGATLDDSAGVTVEPESEPAPAPDEELATAFTRRDEAIVPLIVTAARKVKRAMADEQNGVLDTLRGRQPVTTLGAITPELDDHIAVYVAAIADELAAAAAAGARELGAKDTKTLRRTLERAGALESARALVRTDLVGPLRSRIERAVADGSGDNDDITKRVRAVYREFKTQHIDDQLDDVFRFAFGGGLAVTVEPGTPIAWTIDPSEQACADCEDNSLAGTVASGESFPTGHTSAPAHAGCRCLTLPAQQ